MNSRSLLHLPACLFLLSAFAQAETKTIVARNQENLPGVAAFKEVPGPFLGDAAAKATFRLLTGERDRNGGELSKLQDGRPASGDDQPRENFFFAQGGAGGRILADLGALIDIKAINTFSRHSDVRAPQVYKVYAADGTQPGFNGQPGNGVDPLTCGWKLLASVDTRPAAAPMGGQYAVSIADSAATLGKYRYLIFEVAPTETADPFGLTFLSEIDVIDAAAPTPSLAEAASEPISFKSADGKYLFLIDTNGAADLREWSEKELGPVVAQWYPKIVEMLPSEGFSAPTRVYFRFREDMGGTPASAGGSQVNCNLEWFRRSLKGEAKGAVVHELVHVAQQYGNARRTNASPTRTPGWVSEGIPDYIRWFLYEPQTRGAELTRRNVAAARYDASYRVTGNFLNWVTGKFDKELIRKLNAAAREGRYSEQIWKDLTGKPVEDLNAEWKKENEERLAQPGT